MTNRLQRDEALLLATDSSKGYKWKGNICQSFLLLQVQASIGK